MKDKNKTKEQLVRELEELRAELDELKGAAGAKSLARESLRRIVEMYRALFNQASDCVLLMEVQEGGEPVIIDANIAACKMHGYKKEELIGKSISMLDTPETAAHIRERSERLMKGKELFFEGEHVRKDGSLFPVEVSARVIKVAGTSYILAIDRDITKRKTAEGQLKASARELRESNQKLEGFAYLASHELHAPLIALVRNLGILMGKVPPSMEAECKTYLISAKRSAEDMLASVRKLMDISKLPKEPQQQQKRKEERV